MSARACFSCGRPLKQKMLPAGKAAWVCKSPTCPAYNAQRPASVAALRSAPRAISPASPQQRAKVKDKACVVCAKQPCHPAHLIDRSLGGGNDPLAVVPLCPVHHRAYDDGKLSLLEYLEPHYRAELAHGLELVGLLRLLERVTNQRWMPVAERDAA